MRYILAILINLKFIISEKCFTDIGDISTEIPKWIRTSMSRCKEEDNCRATDFYDTQFYHFQAREDYPQVSVISGWGQYPAHPVGWQGLFYYDHPVLREKEGDGVYIYPDWTSCVQGTWINYILEKGQYCTISEVCLTDEGMISLKTSVTPDTADHSLTYDSPSYHDFGTDPSLMDPFENNTVTVRKSDIEGEGLFTTRPVAKGELVSFYSGYIVNKDFILSPLNYTLHLMTKADWMWAKKYTVLIHNETHDNSHWFDLAIDIPAEMGDFDSYRATLGHKANTSPEANAKITLFTAHPVLGVIMSLVAEKDIPAGKEVTIKKDESLYQP